MNFYNGNLETFTMRSFKLLIGFLPLMLLAATVGPQISVYAGSNNEVSCYERGLIDGEDHPFSQSTLDQCGDDYYQGFLEGCMSVDGNDRDICESATDA